MNTTIKRNGKRSLWKLLVKNILIIAIVAEIIIGQLINPSFLTTGNIGVILYSCSALGILAIAESLVLLVAEIDLTVGASAFISPALAIYATNGIYEATTGVSIMRGGYISDGWVLIVIFTFLIAGVIGLINGLLVVKGKIPAFIATIGMQFTIVGIGFLVTKGTPLFLTRLEGAEVLGNANIGIIPVCFLVFAAVAALFIFLTRKTKFGMRIYATGGNQKATTLCGINPGKWKIIMYLLSGLLVALSGLIFMSKLQAIDVSQIASYEMTALAIAIIGGMELSGGVGSIGGTVTSTFFMAILLNVMSLAGLLSYHETFVTGLMIVIFAIAHKKRDSKRMRELNIVEV